MSAPTQPSNRKAYVALAIVSFFWGTTYLVSRVAVLHIPGLFLAGIRNLIAGSAIITFLLFRGYKIPDLKSLKQLAFLGFVMISFSSGLSHWSVQYISGGLAAIIGATIPLWMAIFSSVFYKEKKITVQIVLGLLIGFSGIAIIFYDHLSELFNSSFRLGVILASVSCITWSAGSVYSSKIKLKTGLLFSVGWQMFFAGIFLICASVLLGQTTNLSAVPQKTWIALFYLVIIGSVITYSCYIYAINHLPPARVGIYAYINPIVAILLGNLFLNERLNSMIIIGTLVTIGGVYLVNSGNRKLNSSSSI